MIFFLFGPDTFRSRQKLKEIKAKFIKEVDKSALNIETLDGQDLEPVAFKQAVFAVPFLAKKRLVIVENLLGSPRGQKKQKEILEILETDLPQETIIVFWEGGLTRPKTKKSRPAAGKSPGLFNFLKKEKLAQEFNLLNQNEVFRWAASEVKKRGGKINPDALKLLTDLVGDDLWQLNSEVDKLLAQARGKAVGLIEVSELVKTKLEEDIYKLTDALGQKNKSLATKLIGDQLKSGTNPVELLAKITWQFKNLLLVKEFSQKNGLGYAADRLSYQLGLHPFVVKKTLAQIKFFQPNQLKQLYRRLLEIDYKLKISQTDPEVLFDLLVIKS